MRKQFLILTLMAGFAPALAFAQAGPPLPGPNSSSPSGSSSDFAKPYTRTGPQIQPTGPSAPYGLGARQGPSPRSGPTPSSSGPYRP